MNAFDTIRHWLDSEQEALDALGTVTNAIDEVVRQVDQTKVEEEFRKLIHMPPEDIAEYYTFVIIRKAQYDRLLAAIERLRGLG